MRKRAKRMLAVLAAACLGITMIPGLPSKAADTEGTIYYVDEDGGDDSNSGTSEGEAWSSLDKVNNTEFKPGDTLLFQRGDTWTGQLSPKGSGEEGKPITIGAYGEGDSFPRIDGNNWCGENGDNLEERIFNAAVYFYNQQYWEITSLEVTNRIPGENPDDHIKKYGILIMGEDAGTLKHMYVNGCYVHDVVSHPIGQQAGIGRGGIIYIIRGNQTPTSWDDIVVENNKVGPNINHYGINFLSTWGSSRFAHESGIPDSEYAGKRVNSTNIVIRNNYCKDIGNAAICPSAYSNVLIEHNTCDGCNSGPNGNVPVWWENGDYTVVQFNEVFGSGASDSKEDSQAFDADVNAKLNYIQYNYTHDNPSGAFFECALGTPYTTHIRYNISENDGYGTNSYGGGAVVTIGGYSSGPNSKMYVYNNDFYLSEGHDSYITNSWDGQQLNDENFQFKNNLIYSDANSKGWHQYFKGTADNNAYGGSDPNIRRDDDENAIEVDASEFAGLGTGPDGYKIKENAGCVGAGTIIPGNGGLDYYGNPVADDAAPNIGADNSFAVGTTADRGIDFEDRPEEETALSGEYADCMFGEGLLTAKDRNSKVLYGDGTTDTYTITLPDNKTLESFQGYCSGTALVKMSGAGYERKFNLTSLKNTYNTDFPSAVKELTITVTSPKGSQDVKFDNLVLKDAQYERNNLALNKAATTNGVDQNPPSYGNDGDESTMWIHEGDDVENSYWFVDLGEDYDLSDFELVFEQDEEDAWGYYIQAARDGEEFFEETPIYDASDNEDGSRVQRGSFEPGSVYRFVLVQITKMPGNDYWPAFSEFKVYGREKGSIDKAALTELIQKVKYMEKGNYTDESWQNLMDAFAKAKSEYDALDTKEKVEISVKELQSAINRLSVNDDPNYNLALNKTVTTSADSYYNGDASNGNDGSKDTMWIVNGDAVSQLLPQWWMADLGKEYILSNYQLDFEEDHQAGAWKYKIEGSKNGTDFDLLKEQTNSPEGTRSETGEFTSTESYRYVRVTLTGFPEWNGADYWPAFAEFAVYGQSVQTVDKELLEAKIIGAKTIGPEKYTEDSYADLQQAIVDAQAIVDDENASQTEVDEETEALEAVIKALEKKEIEGVKKNRLTALVTGLEKLDENLYTPESLEQLTKALNGAEEAINETWYTQEMVDEKTALLKDAMEKLEPLTDVTEDELVNNNAVVRIAQAEALDETAYTPGSLQDVKDEMAALRDLLENGGTTNEMKAGTDKLISALEALADAGTEEPVNKDLLNAKLEEARAIEKGDYTDESYDNLQRAILEAQGVYENDAATQEEVDGQAILLEEAIGNLKKIETPDVPDNPDNKPVNPDNPNGGNTGGNSSIGTGSGQGNNGVVKPDNNGKGVKAAKTGDEAPIGSMAFMMTVMAGIIFISRKRRSK